MRIIDAEGATLGRLCTYVAKALLKGEEIVIINSEKAVISGKKNMIKEEYKQKREVGTYRKGPFFPRMPDRIVKRTVRGMLPYQTPHGRAAFKRLKCYIGVPEEFKNKKAEVIEEAKKDHVDYITIEELSRYLGAKF
ncbi:MAG TPA: 50S ribosomal protein L13 [Thermoplasmatales archaeon]|nr:50S ribosomal protein L13 [Thermoplasmatales archaeon]